MTATTAVRVLSSRASSILSSLNIPTASAGGVVPGVYDGGTWGGSGEPITSKCPSTGEVLARVATVSYTEVVDSRLDVVCDPVTLMVVCVSRLRTKS